jgi:4-hydroxybenzoate polyprenyltransferase
MLLSFTVSNQCHGNGPKEDAMLKPYRPIPSKKISIEAAKMLRILMVPIVIMFATIFGGLKACLAIVAVTLYYNEGSGSEHWLSKNGCGSLFYATFEWGATLVASENFLSDKSPVPN